jgi:hypothetical protein
METKGGPDIGGQGTNGGQDGLTFNKYKTQENIFSAISKTLVEWFQLALVAQCQRGKFFEDVGHLADGPVAQQILLA